MPDAIVLGAVCAHGRPGVGGDLPTRVVWSNAGPDAPRLLLLETPEGGGVRVNSRALTNESVLAAVAQDPLFADAAARCDFLARAGNDPPLDAADLRAGGCE